MELLFRNEKSARSQTVLVGHPQSLAALTADGAALVYPPGYCHFGLFLDEIYFKQITSECLGEKVERGRRQQIWLIKGHAENHFLDCRIYNMALADAYLASFTGDDWARRAKERGIPADLRTPDLFALRAFANVEPASIEAPWRPVAPAQSDAFARLARLNEGL